jgi:heme A synthase
MAEFDSPGAVLHAAEHVRAAGYRRWDVFSPFPIHGLDKVMGYRNSHVGAISLLLGAGAFFSVVVLIWYANTFDYPLIVGGKPMFSAPMTFVPSYILLIMGAAFGALLGMLGLNQLPRLYHPVLAKKRFEMVTRDKFIIVIGAQDEKFQDAETRKLLASIGGANIEAVEDAE